MIYRTPDVKWSDDKYSVAFPVYQSWPSIPGFNFAYEIMQQTCLLLLYYLEIKQHAPCVC